MMSMNFEMALEKFNVGSYIFLSVFFMSAVIQLILAFLEKEHYRRLEKPLCLFSLGMFALVTLPHEPLIYVGAFLGMIGDIFVIIKDRKFFNFGVFSFLLGHICYALEISLVIFNFAFKWYEYLIIGLSFILFYVLLSLFTFKHSKSEVEIFGVGLYYGLLFTLLPLIIIVYISQGSFMYLALIGIIFFIISDLIILYTKYIKTFKRYDFYIMSSYLSAQFFLIFAMVVTCIEISL